MKAATLTSPQEVSKRPLRIGEVATPQPKEGQVLLRVRACGVCRTDLHIVEGELPVLRCGIIPGHQIVGEVVGGTASKLAVGTRVGVSWMGGTDGTCRYCLMGSENLCDSPAFTGYTVNGGYAEYAAVRADFAYSLNPPAYVGFSGTPSQILNCNPNPPPNQPNPSYCQSSPQSISHFQFFFSIGQTF